MSRPRRILIVENHTDTSEMLSEWLKSNGFEVEVAADRYIAMQKVADNPPDVIITDFSMHGSTAATFLRHCRTACPQCKIAIISAAKGVEAIAKKLGVQTVFTKPFDPDEVAAFVR